MKFKNYRNSHTNEDKIYLRKNIADMSVREAFSRKDEIMAQHDSIGIPSEGELQSSPNAVWIEAYTREDGTEVKGHWRSKLEGSDSNTYDNGEVTGGAANVQEKGLKKEEKDTPEMTKSAELQENTIKNMPISVVKSNPEQEYYRIAFELKKANKTGEIPEWIKEHNDIRTLDKVGNEDNRNALKEKIIQGAKDNNDDETLNNLDKVYVVTAKPDSNLTKIIENNKYLNNEFEKKYGDIVSGKYENSYFSIDFPKSEHKIIADYNKDFSTHNTIGRCDVHNIKLESNGDVSATIIDYYDFDKHNTTEYIRNAYLQQQNGRLSNYALMIPIRVKFKK